MVPRGVNFRHTAPIRIRQICAPLRPQAMARAVSSNLGCITTTGKTPRRRAQAGQVATAAHKIWNTDEVNARRNLMYITDVLTCSLRRAPEDAADVPISKWCPRAPRMASVLCPRGSAKAQGPGVRIFLRYLAGEWGEERAASRRELTFVSHGVRRIVDAGCTTPAECCDLGQ